MKTRKKMKKLILLSLAMFLILNLHAQEGDTTKVGVGKKNIVTVTEDDEGTNVNVQEDFVIVDERDDTVKVKLGNKAISITEDGNKTHVEIIEEEDFDKHGWRKKPQRFKGHWAGFELGLNNWLDPSGQLAGTKPEHDFLDLNTGKSWEFNLNFMQYSLPFGKPVGMVTGMGLKWNNYYFNRNNSIMKDPVSGVIVIKNGDDLGITYNKTKLNTTYLTVPLIIEFQFGPKKKGFVSAGVIGDLKLGSNTRVKYYENGTKQKEKIRSDFNISPLRYHLTARIGYRFVKLFANYSMIPMFEKNMGPELHPLTIGLTLISFR
jgi:hypothetical protein